VKFLFIRTDCTIKNSFSLKNLTILCQKLSLHHCISLLRGLILNDNFGSSHTDQEISDPDPTGQVIINLDPDPV